MSYFVVNSECNGCLACVFNCPANALKSEDKGIFRTIYHNMSKCARCGNCWRICPMQAIDFSFLLKNEWSAVVSLPLLECEDCHDASIPAALAESLTQKIPDQIKPSCFKHPRGIDYLMQAYFPGKKRIKKEEQE